MCAVSLVCQTNNIITFASVIKSAESSGIQGFPTLTLTLPMRVLKKEEIR
jgi:hypothetical protein